MKKIKINFIIFPFLSVGRMLLSLCSLLLNCQSKKMESNKKEVVEEVLAETELAYGGSKTSFKGVDFYIYKVNPQTEQLHLWLKDDAGNSYKNIGNLRNDIIQKGKELVFAMNAGMYLCDHSPQGLYIGN